MNEKDFNNLKKLVEKKNQNFITYDKALSLLSDKSFDKILNKLIYYILIFKRNIF